MRWRNVEQTREEKKNKAKNIPNNNKNKIKTIGSSNTFIHERSGSVDRVAEWWRRLTETRIMISTVWNQPNPSRNDILIKINVKSNWMHVNEWQLKWNGKTAPTTSPNATTKWIALRKAATERERQINRNDCAIRVNRYVFPAYHENQDIRMQVRSKRI